MKTKNNNFKEYLRIAIPIISLSITPFVKLYQKVTVLEERVENRKKDIKSLYDLVDKLERHSSANDKDIYVTIGSLRERIAYLEAKNR